MSSIKKITPEVISNRVERETSILVRELKKQVKEILSEAEELNVGGFFYADDIPKYHNSLNEAIQREALKRTED